MAKEKMYELYSSEHEVDLTDYTDIIKDTIEEVVPGKHPKVFPDYFTTDELTQGEAVAIGRALSRQPQLSKFGERRETFRLFRGHTVEVQDKGCSIAETHKGGRKK